jgi:hypothetical protein
MKKRDYLHDKQKRIGDLLKINEKNIKDSLEKDGMPFLFPLEMTIHS